MGVYRRILLKLSGGALKPQSVGSSVVVNPEFISELAHDIATVVGLSTEVGIVIGGGNWFRGAQGAAQGMNRVTADQIGMLATFMNALVMRDALINVKLEACILSAIGGVQGVEVFDSIKARYYLSKGKVVIFAGGTGNPFVSTDSAASLRALEIEADIVLKATSVNGVYNKDPLKAWKTRLYSHLSYEQVIQKELQVMDLAAFIQCRDYHLPIRIFNIHTPHNLVKVVQGKPVGTLISERER